MREGEKEKTNPDTPLTTLDGTTRETKNVLTQTPKKRGVDERCKILPGFSFASGSERLFEFFEATFQFHDLKSIKKVV